MQLYSQVRDAVLEAVRKGELIDGQKLPSINSLSAHLRVSRSTIEKGYCDLIRKGIIESHRGKGFFVKNAEVFASPRIIFFFSKFSGYEKMIFDAFSQVLGRITTIEMVVYHNDVKNLSRIIKEMKTSFSHYLIVPGFSEGGGKRMLRHQRAGGG